MVENSFKLGDKVKCQGYISKKNTEYIYATKKILTKKIKRHILHWKNQSFI